MSGCGRTGSPIVVAIEWYQPTNVTITMECPGSFGMGAGVLGALPSLLLVACPGFVGVGGCVVPVGVVALEVGAAVGDVVVVLGIDEGELVESGGVGVGEGGG